MKYNIDTCDNVMQESIRSILIDLPQWFGIASALEEYVIQSLNKVVVSAQENDKIIGFLTLKNTSDVTMEIYVMGINPSFHRQGIGKQLLDMAKEYGLCHGIHYLQVKTLSPNANDVDYLKTYAFYKQNGFEDVEVLPLWDEWNPCLLMIQTL